MTNEEKARELGDRLINAVGHTVKDRKEIIDITNEMIEWKEQQIIEKAVKWMEENINNYIVNDQYELPNGSMSRDWLKIKSECFTDFKKAMEE